MTKTLSKSTRRLRYAQLKTFFNFIIEKCLPDLKNPCSAPLLSKTLRRLTIKTPKSGNESKVNIQVKII